MVLARLMTTKSKSIVVNFTTDALNRCDFFQEHNGCIKRRYEITELSSNVGGGPLFVHKYGKTGAITV